MLMFKRLIMGENPSANFFTDKVYYFFCKLLRGMFYDAIAVQINTT